MEGPGEMSSDGETEKDSQQIWYLLLGSLKVCPKGSRVKGCTMYNCHVPCTTMYQDNCLREVGPKGREVGILGL